MRILTLLVFTFFNWYIPFAASAQTAGSVNTTSSENLYQNAALSYKIIDAAEGTFGYDIYIDGIFTIHQLTRPALESNRGFATKENAEKVAILVIEKIKDNQMPPSVTVEEMQKAGAL